MADRIPLDFVPSTAAELAQCLADPHWRVGSGALYKIMVKEDEDDAGTVVPFKPNRAQRRFMSRLHHRNIILKARQLGFCVSPQTRVLTASLEWKPIGEIQPGEQVVAVDEFGAGGKGQARRMRTADVVAVKRMQAERFRITFDDGRSGTTFSESLMTVAHDAKNFGARVVPTLEQKGLYWNLLELVMVEPEAGEAVAFITENNENRLLAIARGLKPVAWTDDQLHDLLTSKGIGSVKEIPLAEYEAIIDAIKAGPKK